MASISGCFSAESEEGGLRNRSRRVCSVSKKKRMMFRVGNVAGEKAQSHGRILCVFV